MATGTLVSSAQSGWSTPSLSKSFKYVPIFRAVDIFRRCAEDGYACLIKRKSKIVGHLTAGRDDDAFRPLEVCDVENTLERKLFEVEPVRHVVIGRDGFGIVIHHDGLVALRLERLQCLHGRPVELDRRADAIRATPQHRDAFFTRLYVVLGAVVGEIEIVRLRRGILPPGYRCV